MLECAKYEHRYFICRETINQSASHVWQSLLQSFSMLKLCLPRKSPSKEKQLDAIRRDVMNMLARQAD